MYISKWVKNIMRRYMKYENFLYHIRKPLKPLHQRKIVFYIEKPDYPQRDRRKSRWLSQGAFTNLYHKYKQEAKSRKKIFDLTREQFKELTSNKCFYCGSPPNNSFNKIHRGKPASIEPYVYNGIDRVDSKKDYIISNCVSCCKVCNRMKSTIDLDIFRKKIKKIYNHLKL